MKSRLRSEERKLAHRLEVSTKPSPPRITVLLARNAPVAVIIRRGPSKQTQIVLWRTDTDTFEFGQWFMEDIQWADFDKNGDLLFAKTGKVYRLSHTSEPPYLPPLETATELLDLSNYSFEEVVPPGWAREW